MSTDRENTVRALVADLVDPNANVTSLLNTLYMFGIRDPEGLLNEALRRAGRKSLSNIERARAARGRGEL
jgi:hypothetical protein